MIQVKKYKGDENFQTLLEENGCRKSIDFAKAAILGAQTSPAAFTIDNVMLELFDDAEIPHADNEAWIQLEALWYQLYAVQRFPDCPHIKPQFQEKTRDNYVQYVQNQVEAGEEYLRYLHLGNIDAFRDDPKVDKVYKIFSGNLQLLRTLCKSMNEKWDENEFADDTSFLEKLEKFVRVMWDTKITLKEKSKQKKLEKNRKKTIIEKIEDEFGHKLQRNDPCPCGSGKKYKNCCGSN
ncbi:MAG TPA: SEC-C metal-binding domain-containing protein [Spirochaetota bacterium]|nr:SEC-C metal-binding domain-containing protein [Spirochaetota bacterium]